MTTAVGRTSPVRVAIVDDSRSIRRWIKTVLEEDARMQVVAEASDGYEALEMLRDIEVDIMTLDVDMPRMSGIELLSRVMSHHPMPVVMLSALTEEGSCEAVKALSLGAVDCIEKPRSALNSRITQDIRDRVLLASQTRVDLGFRSHVSLQKPISPHVVKPWQGPVILLGASTGGVAALETVLFELENHPSPVVIAQHMPLNFLRSFSRRLNEYFSRKFFLAKEGLVLQAGQAVIAVGKDFSTRLERTNAGEIRCGIGPPSEGARYHPCIDDLFSSSAQAGLHGNAALLTGMGSDGAQGLRDLHDAGFFTCAQNEESCVVYGMPKAAIALEAADKIGTPQEIGRILAQNTVAFEAQAKGSH